MVARIYDPRRAEVYERLGIPTVATVRWTTDQMLRRMLPAGAVTATGATRAATIRLAEVPLHDGWVGRRLTRIEQAAPAPGSPSSPASARACSPSRTPSCRRATCCTCSCADRDLDAVEAVLAKAAPGG